MSDVTSGIIPFGAIPDTNTLPDNVYRMRVESVTPVLTKEREGKNQKLMFKLDAVVVEPAVSKGQHWFEQYCVGSEDDPEAEELKTWSQTIGAKDFKKFVNATDVKFGDEEDRAAFCNALVKSEFIVQLIEQTEPAKKKIDGVEQDNPWAGKVRNKAIGYYKLGEKEAGSGTTAPTKVATNGNGKPATLGAKPAPSDEVKCVQCGIRIKRSAIKAHVEEHLAQMGQDQDE